MIYAVEIITGLYLFGISVEDIRKKKLPVPVIIAGVIIIPLFAAVDKEMSWKLRLLGLLPGILFTIISYASKGGVGKADAAVVAILGPALGCERITVILAAAFLVIVVYSGIMLIAGRLKMKSAIPFLPFIFAGYLVSVAAAYF